MPTVQTNPATMSSRTDKGVRRPFGNINVNRADTTNVGSTGKPAVIKPTHRSVQSFPPAAAHVPKANPITITSSSNTVVSPSRDAPLSLESRQAPSIFRDDSCFEEERTGAADDLLSLKLANPVTESCERADEAPERQEEEEDDDDLFLPFTRIDNTAIIESYDTLQLRSIFRKPLNNNNQFNTTTHGLQRATPIVDDEDCWSVGEIHPEQTQTLYTHSVLAESMLITDLLHVA